ncbi:MAG: type II toxin-antitoxin system death-on-curing family toxin [Streptosporangiales bacterium]|nr:type II toxin-antitoxin system death-on-curing family toxin [Streptosporangiales bacterium]
MTRYVSVEQALELAAVACERSPEDPPPLRDAGLLDSAIHRPQAAMFGQEAYPDLVEKAAAPLQSLVVNPPFIDGNKRAAWLVTTVFLRKNDVRLQPAEDAAYDLVVSVAAGELEEVKEIADILRSFVRSG